MNDHDEHDEHDEHDHSRIVPLDERRARHPHSEAMLPISLAVYDAVDRSWAAQDDPARLADLLTVGAAALLVRFEGRRIIVDAIRPPEVTEPPERGTGQYL